MRLGSFAIADIDMTWELRFIATERSPQLLWLVVKLLDEASSTLILTFALFIFLFPLSSSVGYSGGQFYIVLIEAGAH